MPIHRRKGFASRKWAGAGERGSAELLRQIQHLTRRVSELESRLPSQDTMAENPALVRQRMVERWEAINQEEDEEAQGWPETLPHAA